MGERLSLDRFRTLAEAYGSDIARWPEPDRAAARRTAFEPGAQAILRRAAALDEALDEWYVPSPDQAMVRRIVASAPAGRRAERWRRARLWWSAIGLVAALAGAGAGALAASAIAAAAGAPTDTGTAFGDVDGQDG